MFLLGETVGKYQILANLGSGGFGTVFLARDTWIDKKVAIKVPHRQTGDVDELLQEPRLLAALDHPNIVGILTAERTDGTFFIVMEYVKGESLEAVLDREKSLDVPRAPQLRGADPEGRRARARRADPAPRPAAGQRADLGERRRSRWPTSAPRACSRSRTRRP